MTTANQSQMLYIVRHAETIENHTRIVQGQQEGKLSECGLKQAQTLSEHLREIPFHGVYASDLGRVRETLAPFLEKTGIEAVFTPLLRERGFGEIEGETYDQYQAVLQESGESHADFRPNGGENLVDVVNRAHTFLQSLPFEAGNALILTHGGMVRSLMAALLSGPVEEYLGFPVENTSITLIERNQGGGVKLIEKNRTAHIVETSEISSLGLDVHTK